MGTVKALVSALALAVTLPACGSDDDPSGNGLDDASAIVTDATIDSRAEDAPPTSNIDAGADVAAPTDAAADSARDGSVSRDAAAEQDAAIADGRADGAGNADSSSDVNTPDVNTPDATAANDAASPVDASADAKPDVIVNPPADAGSDAPSPAADASTPDATVPAAKFEIEIGYYFGCAWSSAGVAKCWGSNAYGQLGRGIASDPGVAANPVTPAIPGISLGATARVKSVVGGSFHACAVLTDGSVRCWGNNADGQLGYGDVKTRGLSAADLGAALPAVQLGAGRTARMLAVGNGHSCALLDNGSIKCWGRNQYGQLGIGTGDNRGDQASEMGDKLLGVDLGTGRTARSIYAGSFHTCALLDNGSVKCWGHNQHGQLGLGDLENRGDAPSEIGNALPAVQLGTGSVISIYAGGYISCARFANGSVKCWGHNVEGELGLGDSDVRGDEPGEMGNALPVIPLPPGRRCVETAAGLYHLCLLLDDGSVRCFGSGTEGQLGSGSTANLGDSPSEIGSNARAVALGGAKIRHISAGAFSVCALSTEDELRCWGRNAEGELGITGSNRGAAPGDMGAALPSFTPF